MKLLTLLLSMAITVAAVFGYFHWASRTPVAPDDSAEVVFQVKEGESFSTLGKRLVSDNFVRSLTVWRVYLKLNRKLPTAKAGAHKLSRAMAVPEIIDQLAKPPLLEDESLTMVEGWRLEDADDYLAREGWIKKGQYLALAKQPDKFKIPFEFKGKDLAGYLLPNTYNFVKKRFDAKALIQKQIDGFVKGFYKPHKKEIAKSKYPLHTVVVMASLLEREEPKPKVRPKVAGVLYNRVDRKIPLGVDATSRFLLKDWSNRKAFLKALRDKNDPYNTRLRAGLPPGPIGAPSVISLISALRPKRSKYIYYLHDHNKKIHFSRTAKQHEAKRKKYNVY